MKVWIDNTGLHSVGQCLAGQASVSNDYEVRGLLQLATLLIFSDQISVNGFEDARIADRSTAIVEQLEEIGIPKGTANIRALNEAEYALACQTAASTIAGELTDVFSPNHRPLEGGPADLPRGFRERQIEAIGLCNKAPASTTLRRVVAHSLSDKAIGAVEYMLASNEALRAAVRQTIATHTPWDDEKGYQLNIFLRYHLNVALAEQEFSTYAPAIARAELIQAEQQYVLQAVQHVVDGVVEELRGSPLGIPSTLAALVGRSRGEPRALLKVALEFREHSVLLRRSLGALSRKHTAETPEGRFEIRREISELGQQLRRDVGLEGAARLRDAIEFPLLLGVLPTPSLSSQALARWYSERTKRKRTAVLTEIVKASAFAELPKDPLERLRHACRKRSA